VLVAQARRDLGEGRERPGLALARATSHEDRDRAAGGEAEALVQRLRGGVALAGAEREAPLSPRRRS
jgi:hypothetical protein